jgi:hypothetical protein
MHDDIVYFDENGELTEEAMLFLYEQEQEGMLV